MSKFPIDSDLPKFGYYPTFTKSFEELRIKARSDIKVIITNLPEGKTWLFEMNYAL